MSQKQRTIPAMFEGSVEKFAKNNLIYEKLDGKYVGKTYSEVREMVLKFASALLKLGVDKEDRIALLSEGRSEWLVAELAMLYLGIINVPLSVKLNESSELKFRINHAECKYIVVSSRQLGKIREIIAQIKSIEKVIVIGNENNLSGMEISYESIINSHFEKNDEKRILEIANNLSENDLANISYTSGTTADPKGIMLSHRNYTANVEQAKSLINVYVYYNSLLILPWDHSFAHTVGLYTLIDNGASMSVVELGSTLIETLKNIPKNIKETKPTFLLSVPALAKNFRKNIENGVREKGPIVQKLFKAGLALAYKYNGIGWDKGKGLRFLLKPLVFLFDKILFAKIRENFGGRLEFFIGGGALLDIELQRFFYAIGIPMYQGYGLSEASPIISSNAPLRHKLGSSGFLVDNLELRIIDENGKSLEVGNKGEIVVKGDNVMKGYWRNESTTKETLIDGWLHTGDMGYMDNDGFLYVLGRFKSLLIGNDGEKYSPEGIEEAMVEQSPFIDQIMLYNDQNAYTIALLYPNYSAIKTEIAKRQIVAEPDKMALLTALIIQEEVDKYFLDGQYSKMFPSRWLPAAIGIVDEAFSEENKLVNSTMKLIRGKVVERYSTLINELYTAEGKDITNNLNINTIRKNL